MSPTRRPTNPRLFFAGILAATVLFGTASASAQPPETRTMVAFEIVRLAMAEQKWDVALTKIAELRTTLGDRPDLLALHAEAAWGMGDAEAAARSAYAALESDDASFKSSPGYAKVLEIAAQSEMRRIDTGSYEQTDAQGYWRDPQTALLWAARSNGADIDWSGAKAYCDALAVATFEDWRLPTILEMRAIFDPDVPRSQLYMRARVNHREWKQYWSSTPAEDGKMWAMLFLIGHPLADLPSSSVPKRAWCVHDPVRLAPAH